MTPDQEKKRDEAVKLLDTHVNAIAEHFENVQIFASRVEPGGEHTLGIRRGCGNVYARRGFCQEWLNEQDEIDREGVREKEA